MLVLFIVLLQMKSDKNKYSNGLGSNWEAGKEQLRNLRLVSFAGHTCPPPGGYVMEDSRMEFIPRVLRARWRPTMPPSGSASSVGYRLYMCL